MIRVGTSGYSYKDWVGPFYPEGTATSDYLPYYAQHFQTTELNFTYYRMPAARTMEQIAAKVGDDFAFSVKAPGSITHEPADDPLVEMQRFQEALIPLAEQGKLASVLAQFPHSFHATDENKAYLEQVREGLQGLAVVVEFRGRDWITDETFDLLRKHQLGFCCVDQPRFENLVPPMAVATGPVAYVRFHGRNYQKWWKHKYAWERYDYTYSTGELQEWVPKVQELEQSAALTLIYMNNHWQGQAIQAAREMRELLADQ